MNIIKLSAIDSTNNYLKDLIQKQFVENFTIIHAKKQTNGKGQMGSSWDTEEGKNLTFSILIKDLITDIQDIFELNVMIAVSIFQTLIKHKINSLNIKWPNDILADKKKIGGILIENLIKSNKEIYSIVGIGLNVNQECFENLPQAGSLKIVSNREFNLDELLIDLAEQIKLNSNNFNQQGKSLFWKIYLKNLFKINIPSTFEINDQKFMGIIRNVTENGQLQVELENETIKEFGIKEIKMLY